MTSGTSGWHEVFGHLLTPSLASRSSSRPTLQTASAPRTLRRSTPTLTPPSARTPPSSPLRRRRTGLRRAKSTRPRSSPWSSASSASRRRSRRSRPRTRSRRLLSLLSGYRPLHVSFYAHPYAAYDPKIRLCYCHVITADTAKEVVCACA